MKIVFLDKSTIGNVSNISKLEQLGEITYYDTTNPGETAERTKEAEIVITNKVVIDQEVMDASPNPSS